MFCKRARLCHFNTVFWLNCMFSVFQYLLLSLNHTSIHSKPTKLHSRGLYEFKKEQHMFRHSQSLACTMRNSQAITLFWNSCARVIFPQTVSVEFIIIFDDCFCGGSSMNKNMQIIHLVSCLCCNTNRMCLTYLLVLCVFFDSNSYSTLHFGRLKKKAYNYLECKLKKICDNGCP